MPDEIIHQSRLVQIFMYAAFMRDIRLDLLCEFHEYLFMESHQILKFEPYPVLKILIEVVVVILKAVELTEEFKRAPRRGAQLFELYLPSCVGEAVFPEKRPFLPVP